MEREVRELVRAFVAAVNSGDADAVADVLADDFVDRTPVPDQREGRDGFIDQKLGELRLAFPDLSLSLEDEVIGVDRVAWRWTLRGTNEGSFAGHPPTGRKVEFQGINIERVAVGRIVEHWSIHDSRKLLEQLELFAEAG
jgi:steroid delta-isomerase-like uncharacterized protein